MAKETPPWMARVNSTRLSLEKLASTLRKRIIQIHPGEVRDAVITALTRNQMVGFPGTSLGFDKTAGLPFCTHKVRPQHVSSWGRAPWMARVNPTRLSLEKLASTLRKRIIQIHPGEVPKRS